MKTKEIKDSGERTVYENGFNRDMSEGKGRYDLLPWNALDAVAKHCEAGAKKYGEHNINLGCPQHSLIDSATRHLGKYIRGITDENHLVAACWNLLFALEQEVLGRDEYIDIPWGKKTVNNVSVAGIDVFETRSSEELIDFVNNEINRKEANGI